MDKASILINQSNSGGDISLNSMRKALGKAGYIDNTYANYD